MPRTSNYGLGNVSPSVVWIGDDVYERVGCKGCHDKDVGDGIAVLGQTLGRKEEVCLVVESEEDCREGTEHVAEQHHRAALTGHQYSPHEYKGQHLGKIPCSLLDVGGNGAVIFQAHLGDSHLQCD